jgi:hypothetical protein
VSGPIQIRMGGYGPPTTSHSRGLKAIGDRLQAEFGDAVDIKYLWNILDLGYQGGDLLWMTSSTSGTSWISAIRRATCCGSPSTEY